MKGKDKWAETELVTKWADKWEEVLCWYWCTSRGHPRHGMYLPVLNVGNFAHPIYFIKDGSSFHYCCRGCTDGQMGSATQASCLSSNLDFWPSPTQDDDQQ